MGNKHRQRPWDPVVRAISASSPAEAFARSSSTQSDQARAGQRLLTAPLVAAVVVSFSVGFGVSARVCLEPMEATLLGQLCATVHPVAAQRSRSLAGIGVPDPWAHTTHPNMATEGWNWTQLSMSRAGNFPPGGVKRYTAQDVRDRGAMWVWHTTFARSIPAVVAGLAAEISERFQDWKLADFRQEWARNDVVVAFSDHPNFNRGVSDPHYGRLVQHPDRVPMSFSDYVDLEENPSPNEYVAVQQSPSRTFAEFGLPDLPPLLGELVKYTLNARNFWAATPPKVSVLHYDWQDSVLVQLSGSKRFTIIDPARVNTAYPCVAYLSQLKRVRQGVFERHVTSRELDNFPLLNVSHPDLKRHPLAKDAHVFTVDVHPGDALLLPAYWFHQVDSYAEPGSLNVAINYWFQGHSLATRLYRTMRENLFINCELLQHPCPDILHPQS